MIPRRAHFVFGLREQTGPFHFLHYASLESCRRVLAPDTICFHHKHLPWGPWWDRIRPHLELVEVDLVPEVLAADYAGENVPREYRYAHHSDFIRLDALIAHGGIYADIDTIFVRPFPQELFESPFVIGRELAVRDERSGQMRPSLCNALLMSEPGAVFAREWRERMADSLNGTWSNHSGFLSEELSGVLPGEVRVEPEHVFYPFPATPGGLAALLEHRRALPAATASVHLWAHLWWDRRRRDFSDVHGERYVPSFVRAAQTTLADIVRRYVPDSPRGGRGKGQRGAPATPAWSYISLDEESGYGVAARRSMDALERAGIPLRWTPFGSGFGWGLGYEPVAGAPQPDQPVVVAHLVAEYLPLVRARQPDAFLVANTVWDTDRIPDGWGPCLDVADLVVVPSRFSADAIERSDVSRPLAIVPHVAPPLAACASSADWSGIPEDTVLFYTIAEWNERKAPFLTIEAYLRAFTRRDRVHLVVKTSHWDRRVSHQVRPSVAGPGTTAFALARQLGSHPNPPAITLITRELTEPEISGLHRRGDCFVSLARGEGWGIGAFDAAAYGTPVVTTGFGGQLDYLRECPYLVPAALVAVQDPAGSSSYTPSQRWADPDVDHAAGLLRQIAAGPRDAAARAQPMAAEIRTQFSPDAVGRAFRGVVEKHRSVSPRSTAHSR